MIRALAVIAASTALGLGCPAPAVAATQLETAQLVLRFGLHGELEQLSACMPRCSDPAAKRLDMRPQGGVVSFAPAEPVPWTVTRRRTQGATVLRFEHGLSGATRTWQVPDVGWLLYLETTPTPPVTMASDTRFAHNEAHGFARLLGRTRYLALHGKEVETTEGKETPLAIGSRPDWAGFRNRYWAVLAKLPAGINGVFTGGLPAQASLEFEGAPGHLAYSFYLGPIEPDALREAAPELRRLMYSGLWQPLRWLCFALFYLLQGIHQWVPHWAASIILLSVSVAILMWPLSRIADRLQREVQHTEARLAPQIRAIKADSRGEEQAERILSLYRAERVHPLYSLKSLVGIAVVIPVFIGAFDMLAENIWLAGERFLWITDIARPDAVATLPFTLPFLGSHFNVLPFVMTALSVLASWLHQAKPATGLPSSPQMQPLVLLAMAFLLLFYTFPAGMVLYWTANNAVAVVRNLRRSRSLIGRT